MTDQTGGTVHAFRTRRTSATKATDHELQKHDKFTRYGQVCRRVGVSPSRPRESPSLSVGWDRAADRASNDADVSSIPPIIPYGGFSPVRLEDWPVRRDLPSSSFSLSLLPACAA